MEIKKLEFYLFAHNNTLCLTSDPIDGIMAPGGSAKITMFITGSAADLEFSEHDFTDFILKSMIEELEGQVEYKSVLAHINTTAARFFEKENLKVEVKELTLQVEGLQPINIKPGGTFEISEESRAAMKELTEQAQELGLYYE